MANYSFDYFVFPSVVRRDTPTTISLIPRGSHGDFRDDLRYTVQFIPMECFNVPYRLDCFQADYDILEVRPRNGILTFTYTFREEQEWSVVVFPTDDPQSSCLFHIFSLEEDLYRCTPYRGDLHAHSNGSDGREAPAVVAANYRKAGFDFMALTDHHRYAPSLEAIRAFEGLPTDFRLFPGEEVHVPGNYVHMVNFGGSFSVNEMYESDPARCTREVETLAENLTVPAGVNPLEYAWRIWIVSHIRDGGGIAILAHPFWTWCHEYNMQTALTRHMLKCGCFDALELLGGLQDRENNLQIALYTDLRGEGCDIPIVGSSDSHGTEPPIDFGKNCTIVLLPGDITQKKLKKAITDHYSVAVSMDHWKPVRVHGTFRMVKYVQFLLENYFPQHDELCALEGTLIREDIQGDHRARELLAQRRGRIREFEGRFFGRERPTE